MNLILTLCLCAATALARPQGNFGLPPNQPPLFPPGFEAILPEDAKSELIALHFNKDLTFEQRRDAIEKVFDKLPREVLEKLPLPPGLERLPEESKKKFRELHMDRSLTWRERHERIQAMVKELPEELQRIVEPPRFPPPFNGMPPSPMMMFGGFPPRPPPGFEWVLAPSIYKQLLVVHQNTALSDAEKKHQIDKIMRSVPQEQLDNLPLPPGFDRLPSESLQRIRSLMHDFSVDWETRHQRIKVFIASLPREERRVLRSPPPPGFEAIPDEVADQIDEIFMNDKLSLSEKHAKVNELIQKLPIEVRAKLPPPPPFMFPHPPAFKQQ